VLFLILNILVEMKTKLLLVYISRPVSKAYMVL